MGMIAATKKRPYFEDLRHVLVGSFAERYTVALMSATRHQTPRAYNCS